MAWVYATEKLDQFLWDNTSYKIEVMWSAKLALQTVKQSKLCTPVITLC
jgi:hypothetical protein